MPFSPHHTRVGADVPTPKRYTIPNVQKKMFWITFTALGLVADLVLPFWWAVGATIPAMMLAWWVAYRSDWF